MDDKKWRPGFLGSLDGYTRYKPFFEITQRLQGFNTERLFPTNLSIMAENMNKISAALEKVKLLNVVSGDLLSQINSSLFGSSYLVRIESFNSKLQQLAWKQNTLLKGIDSSFLESIRLFPLERISRSIKYLNVLGQEFQVSFSLFQQAIAPVLQYQSFANMQFQRALHKNDFIRKRILVITDAVGDRLDDFEGLVTESWGFWHQRHDEGTEPDGLEEAEAIESNFFHTLNEHIGWAYRADRKNVEVHQIIKDSLPGRIQEAGFRLGKLIIDLNMLAEGETGEDLFKPTNNNMKAMLILPMDIAEDERSFSCIVDYLYFLLYEGTSEAKRLLEFVKPEHLDMLWLLKHLRRAFCHDINHGKQSEIAKKLTETGSAFIRLIGLPWPQKSYHWKKAQLRLYEGLVGMLENIMQVKLRQYRNVN